MLVGQTKRGRKNLDQRELTGKEETEERGATRVTWEPSSFIVLLLSSIIGVSCNIL